MWHFVIEILYICDII